MDAVKEYWENKVFLIGIFCCVLGTILGAFGVHTPAVWIEAIGFILIMVIIYKENSKNEIIHSH